MRFIELMTIGSAREVVGVRLSEVRTRIERCFGRLTPVEARDAMSEYMGEIKAICVSEKRGTQKHLLRRADFLTEYGIEGDAHAGNWHRQVSLLGLGENVVADGFTFRELPIGTRLKCGEVFFEITQLGKECHAHCAIYHQIGDQLELTSKKMPLDAPGIGEAMREMSLKITPRAMLSRATAGITRRTLIVNLPGSVKAVDECLNYILPTLLHGIEILRGDDADCARS